MESSESMGGARLDTVKLCNSSAHAACLPLRSSLRFLSREDFVSSGGYGCLSCSASWTLSRRRPSSLTVSNSLKTIMHTRNVTQAESHISTWLSVIMAAAKSAESTVHPSAIPVARPTKSLYNCLYDLFLSFMLTPKGSGGEASSCRQLTISEYYSTSVYKSQ